MWQRGPSIQSMYIYRSMETCPRGVWTCDLIDLSTQGHVTSMTSGGVTRSMRSIQGGLVWYLQGSLFYIQCKSQYIYEYISQCFAIQWWAGQKLRGEELQHLQFITISLLSRHFLLSRIFSWIAFIFVQWFLKRLENHDLWRRKL